MERNALVKAESIKNQEPYMVEINDVEEEAYGLVDGIEDRQTVRGETCL